MLGAGTQEHAEGRPWAGSPAERSVSKPAFVSYYSLLVCYFTFDIFFGHISPAHFHLHTYRQKVAKGWEFR